MARIRDPIRCGLRDAALVVAALSAGHVHVVAAALGPENAEAAIVEVEEADHRRRSARESGRHPPRFLSRLRTTRAATAAAPRAAR